MSAPAPRSGASRTPLLYAWVALACIPVGLLAAMAAGEGVMSLFGYEPGIDNPPLVTDLLIALVSLAAFLVAPMLSIHWGLAARRTGHPFGLVPVVIAGLCALAMTALTLLSAFR